MARTTALAHGGALSIEADFAERAVATGCKLGQALHGMSDTARDRVEKALAAPDAWTTTEIAKRLNANGIGIGRSVIGDHRRGTCACKGKP